MSCPRSIQQPKVKLLLHANHSSRGGPLQVLKLSALTRQRRLSRSSVEPEVIQQEKSEEVHKQAEVEAVVGALLLVDEDQADHSRACETSVFA